MDLSEFEHKNSEVFKKNLTPDITTFLYPLLKEPLFTNI